MRFIAPLSARATSSSEDTPRPQYVVMWTDCAGGEISWRTAKLLQNKPLVVRELKESVAPETAVVGIGESQHPILKSNISYWNIPSYTKLNGKYI